jgi:glycosyltransferase involved in cell wall biosynthesis
MNIFYIAELNIPNSSAYLQHVMKMCDEFSKNYNTTLIIYSKKNYSFLNAKKDYLLKNNFKIISYSKFLIKNSLFNRLKFAFFAKKIINKNKGLIISRSPISSIWLGLNGIFNFLEIHSNLSGITKYFFILSKILKFNKNIFIILIHKNLNKILNINKNFIVLDDGVKIEDFSSSIKCSKKKYDCTYIGSLYRGKGLEIIKHLSVKFKNINFHVFGDIKTIALENINWKEYKNIIFHGFLPYSKVPSILEKSKILLMPYLENVQVKSSNLEVSKFMSPLKLFEYLASRNIILASRMKVYSHILKNNYNCILASPKYFDQWNVILNKVLSNTDNYSYIKKNAYNTAKKFTWENRANIIIKKYNEVKLIKT